LVKEVVDPPPVVCVAIVPSPNFNECAPGRLVKIELT